jgi:hypothetical protein
MITKLQIQMIDETAVTVPVRVSGNSLKIGKDTTVTLSVYREVFSEWPVIEDNGKFSLPTEEGFRLLFGLSTERLDVADHAPYEGRGHFKNGDIVWLVIFHGHPLLAKNLARAFALFAWGQLHEE